MSDLPAIITAIALLVTAIGTYFNGRRIKDVDTVVKGVGETIKEVNKEVKTLNSQTIAELADADESRRIEKIPKKDRTPLEKSHLSDVGRK